jgi:hypothetical protein
LAEALRRGRPRRARPLRGAHGRHGPSGPTTTRTRASTSSTAPSMRSRGRTSATDSPCFRSRWPSGWSDGRLGEPEGNRRRDRDGGTLVRAPESRGRLRHDDWMKVRRAYAPTTVGRHRGRCRRAASRDASEDPVADRPERTPATRHRIDARSGLR